MKHNNSTKIGRNLRGPPSNVRTAGMLHIGPGMGLNWNKREKLEENVEFKHLSLNLMLIIVKILTYFHM